MTKRIFSRILALAVVTLLASGCSTSNIRSNVDPNADFSNYYTWNFIEDAGPDRGEYESLFTQYVKEAIEIEMSNRGYKMADDPDIWVNFNAILQEKTKIREVPSGPPPGYGYYGYRAGYYDPWRGYGWGTETQVSQYTEGTFNIDIIDNEKDQLVWEAVGKARISQQDADNLRERVLAGVPRYFALYPYVAGGTAPAEPANQATR
ncbi:MAG: DUF4136 domain-containing protein [Woeseiaceae bacterium]